MKLVFVCSPFQGDIEGNTQRACGYCRFVHAKGSVPYAPHLHNTRFLDDNIPEERKAGMMMGLQMLKRCDELWCFGERLTDGMLSEIRAAKAAGIPIKYFNHRCEEVENK